jgi:hypothetical protein
MEVNMGNRIREWFAEWGTAAIVILLALMISFQGVTNSHTSSEFKAQTAAVSAQATLETQQLAAVVTADTSAAKVDACRAVKISNDAFRSFIHRQIHVSTSSNPAATRAFLADLDTSLTQVQVQCLTGGN